MKQKVNDLVMLDEAMQKELNTASYSGHIQIFPWVPDKRTQIHF